MKEAKLLDTRTIHKGRVIRVDLDRVRLPNDHVLDIDMVRHPGASAIVPLDADNHVVMVRQYRHAAGDYLLEIPAGRLDPGESPETCAGRELQEETGFRASRLTAMGHIFASPGFCDERIFLFLAQDLTPVGQGLEADEVLTVVRLPLEEALEKARRGEVVDGKSVAALLRTPHYLR